MQTKVMLSLKGLRHSRLVFGVIGPVIVGALLVLNCCSSLQEVDIIGNKADMGLFAGKWEGEYYIPTMDRGGNIFFELVKSENQAHYEVIIPPHGSNQPYRLVHNLADLDIPASHSQWLTISFIQVYGRTISGDFTHYQDSDSGFSLMTTFKGQLKGDIIEGNFTTHIEKSTEYYRGKWRVIRTKRSIE